MPIEKTFNPAEAEARISAMWEAGHCFDAGAGADPGAPPFSVMIPPPNVTGSLHMGHAFNNTLQDILVRWHRMRGFDTLWQVGTDHAGIATQMVTEREMAKAGNQSRREMGREAFTAKVWEQKQKSRGTIIGQLKRLGASCDWSREAFTMSGAPGAPEGEQGNFHDAVIKVFVDLYNKGLIHRGKRLVNWDPHFETAISDLEVENIEMPGHMWHFKYRLAGGETYEYVERDAEGTVTLREVRDYIAIATTRPETMLGDGAVAVHPSDTRYAPIVGKMVHLPLCDRLIPIITDEYPDPLFGSGAVKITGAHDFNDYAVAKRNDIPCYRLMDTRAAMRADGTDYDTAVIRARNIAAGSPTTEGEVDSLNLVPMKYRGLPRDQARKAVVADINAAGLAVTVLVKSTDPETGSEHLTLEPVVEAKKIMQPFGDRSKVVIEPMLTDQWFVDTAKIVEPALEAVRTGATKIIPQSGEKTYYHWLENIEPWCISRQLWWGHQIPVWYGPHPDDIETSAKASTGMKTAFQNFMTDRLKAQQNGEDTTSMKPEWPEGHWSNAAVAANMRQIAICAPTEAEALEKAAELYGSQYEISIHSPTKRQGSKHRPGDGTYITQAQWVSVRSDGKIALQIERDPDVLDTWFSSGLWPIGTLGWPEPTPELQKYFPTSVLVTGQDILFFWVARMMMMQLAVVDDIPFHTVYLHGLVRDAKGKKMSKSLGNVIDPLEIIDEFGADALRFANAAMASLGGVLKLDTSRIAGYRNFGTKLWNACRFAEMNGVWEGHTTNPLPPKAKATVNRWIIAEAARTRADVDAALTDYRFDQAADTLYKFVWGQVCDWYVEFAKPLFDGPDAGETRATMAWVLDQSMILLHPLMPFITEDLWATTGTRQHPLALTRWPADADLTDPDATREMTWVTTLIDTIRSARAEMHVPVGLKLDLLAVTLDAPARAALQRNETLIRRLARMETITNAPAVPKGAITIPVEGGLFALPLAGVIDASAEAARLTKTLDKLDKDLTALRARLANPQFIASAKEEIIDEARERLTTGSEEAAKLHAALKRLAEIG